MGIFFMNIFYYKVNFFIKQKLANPLMKICQFLFLKLILLLYKVSSKHFALRFNFNHINARCQIC